MNNITISTITPVYRGASTLRDLVVAINEFRENLKKHNSPIQLTESIFVDDGSQDGSGNVLKELQKEFEWVHVVTLSRNFGQHPATIAGILYSSGDWIVTLDEDLQHHPKYIEKMLQKAVSSSYDIVYAKPLNPVHESFFRDLSSKSFKWFLSKLTGDKNIPLFNSFRVIRGSIGRAASAISIDQTYFDVALSWFTKRITTEAVELKDLRYIKTGKSGYSFKSLLSHARRLLQTSNLKIVRIGAYIGFLAMILGIIASFITLIEKLFFPELITADGWASLIISILLLGGLNAFLIGLALENISILIMQSHGKPKYFEINRESDIILSNWHNGKQVHEAEG